jgi:hypothetical protein
VSSPAAARCDKKRGGRTVSSCGQACATTYETTRCSANSA